MTEPILDIVWDDAKAQSNLSKHGVAFAQAATIMLDPLASDGRTLVYLGPNQRWSIISGRSHVPDD